MSVRSGEDQGDRRTAGKRDRCRRQNDRTGCLDPAQLWLYHDPGTEDGPAGEADCEETGAQTAGAPDEQGRDFISSGRVRTEKTGGEGQTVKSSVGAGEHSLRMGHREAGRQRRYGKQYRKSGRGKISQYRKLSESGENASPGGGAQYTQLGTADHRYGSAYGF